MNRRGFLRALGIGVAAVYLRIAPEVVKAVPSGILYEHVMAAIEEIFAKTNPAGPNWIVCGPGMARQIGLLSDGCVAESGQALESRSNYAGSNPAVPTLKIGVSMGTVVQWDATPLAGVVLKGSMKSILGV